MQSATLRTTRPAAARTTIVCQASSKPMAAPKKAAFVSLAAFAAAVLINAAPVQAAEVKNVVCASNPTAKLCLKNSAKK
ncbi:hypothetical protein Ndes2526B_g01471 [Nannochloris sp. 'desiccata']|nr:hypothetical protein KSW81_004208 [Chlorella desiccata (nom. nud.)]KAH7624211.1 hypothetical protein NADE_009023 [Chlorella desiccata (nom. nud.)]